MTIFDDGIHVDYVERTASSVTGRTAKPRTLTLFTSDTERPFLLQLDNLYLTIEGDSDLSPTQTTDAEYRVVFQKLVIRPLSRSTCPESCDHNREKDLSFDAGLNP
jgi:hypothetical protein